jgi:hypothetical protein
MKILTISLALLFAANVANIRAQVSPLEPSWTVTLRAGDFLIGGALQKLKTRHHWISDFNDGRFELAVKKSAISIPAPDCRMDYLILTMPAYYPESPAQSTLADRRAVYDALVHMQQIARGTIKIKFDPLWYAKKTPSGEELTTCNIYFTLPLPKDAAVITP